MNTTTDTPLKKDLYPLLDEVSLRDARTFRRRLSKARSSSALAAIAQDINAARVSLAAKGKFTSSYIPGFAPSECETR